MKNKKGFVFVETMVVTVILITSLLLIYSSYTAMSSNEKRRNRYDDPVYIYRTYNIAKFLNELVVLDEDQGVGDSSIDDASITRKSFLREALTMYEETPWVIFEPSSGLEIGLELEGEGSIKSGFFKQMLENYNVSQVVIGKEKDLKELITDPEKSDTEPSCTPVTDPNTGEVVKDPDTGETMCIPNAMFSKIDDQFFRKYIDTIIDPEGNDYYIMVKYSEKANGDSCSLEALYGTDEQIQDKICIDYYASLKLTMKKPIEEPSVMEGSS